MSAPVDHPPPWAWRDDGQLYDANGRQVLGSQGECGIYAYVASGCVGEQLRAAPEMEALLRKAADLVHWLAPFAFAFASMNPGSNMPTKIEIDDAVRASTELLSRIDKARRG